MNAGKVERRLFLSLFLEHALAFFVVTGLWAGLISVCNRNVPTALCDGKDFFSAEGAVKGTHLESQTHNALQDTI